MKAFSAPHEPEADAGWLGWAVPGADGGGMAGRLEAAGSGADAGPAGAVPPLPLTPSGLLPAAGP